MGMGGGLWRGRGKIESVLFIETSRSDHTLPPIKQWIGWVRGTDSEGRGEKYERGPWDVPPEAPNEVLIDDPSDAHPVS